MMETIDLQWFLDILCAINSAWLIIWLRTWHCDDEVLGAHVHYFISFSTLSHNPKFMPSSQFPFFFIDSKIYFAKSNTLLSVYVPIKTELLEFLWADILFPSRELGMKMSVFFSVFSLRTRRFILTWMLKL